MPRSLITLSLADLADGQEADFYVLMTSKEELKTKKNQPYFKVGFRDGRREVSFPIWGDSPWAEECRDQWQPGRYYKVRAVYRESNYGPQLEIRKIRPVTEADRGEGFDEANLQKQSRFDRNEMLAELVAIVQQEIADEPLRKLTLELLEQNREAILRYPAATRNHHAFVGGYIEHVLSVTRTCLFLADKYRAMYPEMEPPLSRDLVIAGGVLHDIGKMRELEPRPEGAVYTAAGDLIGHVLQGRDMVREAAVGKGLDPELQLRLEHIIVSHQRLPEWGAPKPPMTPEALLVHFADDTDAKMQMYVSILAEEAGDAPVTTARNALQQKLYRGRKA